MGKPTEENKQIETDIPIQRCGHKGNWRGVGQSLLSLGAGNVILMVSTVCGECGDTSVSINPVPLTPKKTKDLVLPDNKIVT